MKFTFKKPSSYTAVFLISETGLMPRGLQELDKFGQLVAAIKADKAFSGKSGQMISIIAPHGISLHHIILLCVGKTDEITSLTLQSAGGALAAKLHAMKITECDLYCDFGEKLKVDLALNLMIGIKLRNYNFNKHYVAKKNDHITYLNGVNIIGDHAKSFESHDAIVEGTLFARDLVTESPNNLYPISFAKKCKELESLGLKVVVLDAEDIEKEGMGALLGVAQGSANSPRVVIMKWKGDTTKKEIDVALVGKGVTFDSGGIDLKPSSGIAEMKYDMAGAGAVTGVMHALAVRKAKVNVVGILGLVENMPSGTAQRPSDVVKSMSGQTIEVDNTDAEGRLVLADVMYYVQHYYKPKVVIDIATLTGAIRHALGDYCAGLFSNDQKLADALYSAGETTGEYLWQLPINDYYDKQINSDIADVKNTGQAGRGGGSITAAQFLKRFIQDGYSWAHIDIAAMAWTKFGSDVCPKGATGFGVRLLNQFLMDNFEKK
jgi:leucyl aminopeptidase